MLRCYISEKDHVREWFFLVQGKKFKTLCKTSKYLGISIRTLTDWKRSKYGIPKHLFERLEKIVPYPYKDVLIRDDLELRRISASKGGIVTSSKGMIGTIETRRKGGYASIEIHKAKKTGLFLLKECSSFPHSEETAELLGIIIGDGHLAPGQVEITLDRKEQPYAEYVKNLLQKITGYECVLRNRSETTLAIYLSGKAIIKELHKLGIELGNKTKNQNNIPGWVLKKTQWKRALIRGLFDTDGCLYIDTHTVKGKRYRYWGIALTAYNLSFLGKVGALLIDLGFHPTVSTKYRIILRKQEEISLFMDTIRPVNQKHIKSYPALI